MLIRVPFFIGGLVGLATSALAEAGVPPVASDFHPAVSTQYRPPDGGRAYPKPDTRLLVSPADRRRMQKFESDLNNKPISDTSGSGSGGGSASAAPRRQPRMKDPLALPPASPSTPAPAGSSPPAGSSSPGGSSPLGGTKPLDQPSR